MRDIEKLSLPDNPILGIKTILYSIYEFFKNPILIIFYLYATLLSTVMTILIEWSLKLVFIILCWAEKWKYLELPEWITCHDSPLQQFIEGKENITGLQILDQTLGHLKEIFLAENMSTLLISVGIFLMVILTSLIYLFFINYFSTFSMVAMAQYIDSLESGQKMAPFKALSINKEIKQKIISWALFSTFFFLGVQYISTKIFRGLPLYYMCLAYQIGYTPFTSSIIMFITFFAVPLIAYEKLNLGKLITKLFIIISKAPQATLTCSIILSLFLFFMPSCILPHLKLQDTPTANIILIIFIYISRLISVFITPLCAIFLYRAITRRSRI